MFEEQLPWTSDCTSKGSTLLTSMPMVSDQLCKDGGRCNELPQPWLRSSIMPRVPGRGKDATQPPAAAATSSKMRFFPLFPHPLATQTNDLPIRRAGQA